ncbi:LAFE_0H01398g1_1 [Lachancea fermentati]|uniref:Nuclear fusion protein KAR5 n=1 Tax=Lachancea fermentati TaxID=4955 RepID=A0A1G4MJC3_LACFM|nr:LAFE_0H01398g1_1 [Lachancea fermentati]
MSLFKLISGALLFVATRCDDNDASVVNKIASILDLSHLTPADAQLEKIIESSFPYFKNACVADALQPFLPTCLKHGIETIDPSLRVATAVKLSICEFEASGLKEIPKSCIDLHESRIIDCIRDLEVSPQWWTTYSGNFQHLPTLCFENSLPYEKNQILELFLKITEIYGKFRIEIEAKLQETSQMFDQYFEIKMNKLKRNVETYLQDFYEMTKTYEETLKSFNQTQVTTFKDLSSNSDIFEAHILAMDSELGDQLLFLRETIEDINEQLAGLQIAEEIQKLKKVSLDNLQDISSGTENALKIHQAYIQKIDHSLENFYSDTMNNVENLEYKMQEAHIDSVNILQDFNKLVHVSIIPSLKDELLPHVQEASQLVFKNLQIMDDITNEKIDTWNENLDAVFLEIDSKLKNTASTVEEIDTDLRNFKNGFHQFFSLVETIKTSIGYLHGFIFLTLKHSQKVCSAISSYLICRRLCIFAGPEKNKGEAFFQIFKVLLIVSTALLGSGIGFFLSYEFPRLIMMHTTNGVEEAFPSNHTNSTTDQLQNTPFLPN